MKTVNSSGTAVAKTTTENELRDSVLSMKERYDNAYATLQKKESELNNLIDSATANDSTSLSLSEELEKTNSILGLSAVHGQGIIIRISDGIAPANAIDISNYIVHDVNLRMIVNYLFNAGAEAISINGERIVSSTAITCIGNTIKVNDEKVTTPFEIKAIGLQEKLYGAMTTQGQYLYVLANTTGISIDSIERSDSITVEGYNGIYNFEYASVAE